MQDTVEGHARKPSDLHV